MHIFSVRKRFLSHISFIIVPVVLLIIAPNAASNLNCYVCGFEDGLNECNNFNTSNHDLFIQQCSNGSLGCSTQIKAPNAASNLNCYVCGFEDGLNECNNFNTSNHDLFIQQCSNGSLGCSTQIKGDKIINMACEDVYFNDCKLANFIEYCYCNTNLCNGNMSIKKPITYNPGLNDDEDLTEGSGFRIFTSTNSGTVSTSTLQPTVPTPNTGGCLHSTFIIVAAAIFLL